MNKANNTSFPLSSWAQSISASPTQAIDSKAKALKAAGESLCDFGIGQPDFDSPEFTKDAVKKALDAGHTGYVPAPGLPALRKALASHYISNHNFPNSLNENNIVVSPGAKFSCYLAILATCSPGDEVIVPAPYWVSYPEMVKLSGATPVIIDAPQETHFKITPSQLESAITPKTRLLILNSPSNPTGAVYTKNELIALLEVCLKHDIYILADEIYEYFLFDGAQHFSLATHSPEAFNRVITVSGFSKTFSMTGWRLGTIVAPTPLASAIANIQSQTTSNATSFAQYGALEALLQPEEAAKYIENMRSTFDKRRKLFLSGLNNIPSITCPTPEGAFYLFPDISAFGLSSMDFANQLLDKEKVVVIPGSAFGADKHIRISYATSEAVIEEGIKRIERFCSSLKRG